MFSAFSIPHGDPGHGKVVETELRQAMAVSDRISPCETYSIHPSAGPALHSKGLQATSDGLQPNSDGLQPNSEGLRRTHENAVANGWEWRGSGWEEVKDGRPNNQCKFGCDVFKHIWRSW